MLVSRTTRKFSFSARASFIGYGAYLLFRYAERFRLPPSIGNELFPFFHPLLRIRCPLLFLDERFLYGSPKLSFKELSLPHSLFVQIHHRLKHCRFRSPLLSRNLFHLVGIY